MPAITTRLQPQGPVPAAAPLALVVDDSRAQRRILARLLEGWGYRVREAATGAEALALAAGATPDLVVSDWMMPGMDGLEFCARFRALGAAGYSYFILLTSKRATSEMAAGLDAGADDFLSKPVNPDELRARVNAGARIVSMQRELARTSANLSEVLGHLQEVHEAIDRDLRQARRIQEALIPEQSRAFGSSRVSLFLKSCGHVGGDLVGFFPAGPGKLGLYGIDVSGHGITSAMMTARVAGYLSQRHPAENVALDQAPGGGVAPRPPDAVARLLNARFAADGGIDEYFTMALAVIDTERGRCEMVQAGHPPLLHLRADGSLRLLGEGGLPLGLVSDVAHDSIALDLAPGDRLLIVSDGFAEAPMRTGGMLGEEGMRELVTSCAPWSRGCEFLEELFWRLVARMPEDRGLGDDVSAALFEYRLYPEAGEDPASDAA